MCVFNPGRGLWYGSGGSSGTDLTAMTCQDVSGLVTGSGSVTIYPAAYLGTGQAYGLYGDATNIQVKIPSGWQSWDSCAGGTLKWDSTNKGTAWSLSSGDTIATSTASTMQGQGRGSTGIASNSSCKAIFAYLVVGDHGVSGYYSSHGIVNGSWNLSTTYHGFNTTGAQFTGQSTGNFNCFRYNTSSCSSNAWVGPNIQPQYFSRLGRATTSIAQGELKYFEVQMLGNKIDMGAATSAAVPQYPTSPVAGEGAYVGGPNPNWSSMGYSASSPGSLQGFIGNGAVITSNLPTFYSTKTVGVAVRNRSGGCSTPPQMWFNVDGTWYGSASGADPVTFTNGLSSSNGTDCVTGTLWPAYSVDDNSTSGVATINGGSSAFTYAIPAGYSCLDGSGVGCGGGNRSRVTIIP